MAQLGKAALCSCTCGNCAPAKLCLSIPTATTTCCMPCISQCSTRLKPIIVRGSACSCACAPTQTTCCVPATTCCVPATTCCVPATTCCVPATSSCQQCTTCVPTTQVCTTCIPACSAPACTCIPSCNSGCACVCKQNACSSSCCGQNNDLFLCVPLNQCSISSSCNNRCNNCGNGCSNNCNCGCSNNNCNCGNGCSNNNCNCNCNCTPNNNNNNNQNCNCNCVNGCCCCTNNNNGTNNPNNGGNSNNGGNGNSNNGNNGGNQNGSSPGAGGKRGKKGRRKGTKFRDYSYEDYSEEEFEPPKRKQTKKKKKPAEDTSDKPSIVHHVMTFANNPSTTDKPDFGTIANKLDFLQNNFGPSRSNFNSNDRSNDRPNFNSNGRNYNRNNQFDNYQNNNFNRNRQPFNDNDRPNFNDNLGPSFNDNNPSYNDGRHSSSRYGNQRHPDEPPPRRKNIDVSRRKKRSVDEKLIELPPIQAKHFGERVRLRNPDDHPIFDVRSGKTKDASEISDSIKPNKSTIHQSLRRQRRAPVEVINLNMNDPQHQALIQHINNAIAPRVHLNNPNTSPTWNMPSINTPSMNIQTRPLFQQNSQQNSLPMFTIMPQNIQQNGQPFNNQQSNYNNQQSNYNNQQSNYNNQQQQNGQQSNFNNQQQQSDQQESIENEQPIIQSIIPSTNSSVILSNGNKASSNIHSISSIQVKPKDKYQQSQISPPIFQSNKVNKMNRVNQNEMSGLTTIQIPVHQLIPELRNSTGKTYLHGESIIQRKGNDLHIHHINIEQPKTTTTIPMLSKNGIQSNIQPKVAQILNKNATINQQRHSESQSYSSEEEIPIHVLLGLKDGSGLKELKLEEMNGNQAGRPNLSTHNTSPHISHPNSHSHHQSRPPMKTINGIPASNIELPTHVKPAQYVIPTLG